MGTTISGQLISAGYSNKSSGNWFHGEIITSDGDILSVAGVSDIRVKKGSYIVFDGIEKEHPTYGFQWVPEQKGAFIECIMTGHRDIVDYLGGGLFDGITRTTAEHMYQVYGSKTLVKLYENIDQAAIDCQLNSLQAESLRRNLAGNKKAAQILKALPHMKTATAKRLAKQYEKMNLTDFMGAVRRHPYVFLHKQSSVRTQETDEIAIEDLKIDPFDRRRIEFCIYAALSEFMKNHKATYVKISDSNEWTRFFYRYFLNVTLYRPWPYTTAFSSEWLATEISRWEETIYDMVVVTDTRQGENGIEYDLYQTEILESERYLTKWITEAVNLPFDLFKTRSERFQKYLAGHNSNLTVEQKIAVMSVFQHKISFISGGPGCGKTTAMKLLIKGWGDLGDVLLLGPTGKAVNRLKEQTGGKHAETVAYFLVKNSGRKPQEPPQFCNRPIEDDLNTLVIVDESSMLGFESAARLARMLPESTFVFVGDIDQLPPIEKGPFLSECVKASKDPASKLSVQYLTQNFRTDVAELHENALKIRNGEPLKSLKITPNFMILPSITEIPDGSAYSPAAIGVLQAYQDYLKQGAAYSDIMVMSFFRKQEKSLSTASLNKLFQQMVNPYHSGVAPARRDEYGTYTEGYGYGTGIYDADHVEIRLGDRLICTKNNPDMKLIQFRNDNLYSNSDLIKDTGCGIYNGDTGTVVRRYGPNKNDQFTLVIAMDDTRSEDERIADPKPTTYVFMTAEKTWFGRFDSRQCLNYWALGYTLTVHRAQGSEADHVIVAAENDRLPEWRDEWSLSPFLIKNMLYTAVTRAKKDVLIIGDMKAVEKCLQQSYVSKNLYLCESIRRR